MSATRTLIEDAPVPENLPDAIEANGINTIEADQRQGRARSLFMPWFAANIGIFGMSYGAWALGAPTRVSLWQAIVAGLIGTVGSFLLVGLVSMAGPSASAPTMIISRSAFGVRGNRVAAVLAWMLNVGWETSLVSVTTLAIAAVCGKLGIGSGDGIKIVAIALVTALTLTGAIAGFKLLMRMQTLITLIGAVLTVMVIALSISHVHMHKVTSTPDGSFQAFFGVIMLMATGWGLGWVYCAADYSRYLPRTTPKAKIVGWTAFGGSLAALILFFYSYLLAGSSATLLNNMGDDPIGALTDVLPHWFLVPFIVLAVAGLVGAAALDVYSSGLHLQSLGLRLPRYQTAAIDGVLMTVFSAYIVFATHNFIANFQGFLITLGVPIAAWTGILIGDYFVRRGSYITEDLYNTGGRYGDVRWGPILLLVISSLIGWGLVTTSTNASWLKWQGYLLSLGFGGKSGTWSGADLGVFVALALGFVVTLAMGKSTHIPRHGGA